MKLHGTKLKKVTLSIFSIAVGREYYSVKSELANAIAVELVVKSHRTNRKNP